MWSLDPYQQQQPWNLPEIQMSSENQKLWVGGEGVRGFLMVPVAENLPYKAGTGV